MVIDAGRGTCIDLTLLFLSLIANTKLDPIYVHLGGGDTDHSIAAIRLNEPTQHRPEFVALETLQRDIRRGEIVVIDCTGFVEGYPDHKCKISFEESCRIAEEFVNNTIIALTGLLSSPSTCGLLS